MQERNYINAATVLSLFLVEENVYSASEDTLWWESIQMQQI